MPTARAELAAEVSNELLSMAHDKLDGDLHATVSSLTLALGMALGNLFTTSIATAPDATEAAMEGLAATLRGVVSEYGIDLPGPTQDEVNRKYGVVETH